MLFTDQQTKAFLNKLKHMNRVNPYCVYRYERQEKELALAHPNAFRSLWCYLVKGKQNWAAGPLLGSLTFSPNPVIALFVDHNDLWHVEAIVNLKTTRTSTLTDEKIVDGILRLPLSTPDESREVRKIGANPLRLGKWATDRLGPALEDFLIGKGFGPPAF